MAVTQSTQSDGAHDNTTELDLSLFTDTVPEGTTCEVSAAGDRSAYELEFTRRGDRWLVEGTGSTATLTGVYGDSTRELPDRVPGWIRAVLINAFDISQVSVRQ